MSAPAYCRICSGEMDPVCIGCKRALQRSRDAIDSYHARHRLLLTPEGCANDPIREHEIAEGWDSSTMRAEIDRLSRHP